MTAQKGTGIAGAANYHPPTAAELACWICGNPIAGASYAARVLPPMVQVCSAACAADPRYAMPEKRT